MDIDHLIVGAGTAGCVLAARLSADPLRRVAVLVGEDCRVHGVDGLRIADLSIVPVPLRATTALDAMMVGEHAATLILGT
ncbi:GMC family oxidoreductase N-terminal domain-containing protein [Nonomuraea sp. K274]|uniref:GMC family oxidoreductase N-terminal domain-containing protein n=1 Tax=Nonomuraea cypriaca TaxID=1187855 RepID=A0A931EWA1_9ACTN|nr:GMC oxidoreductase [Nonomuraea cypriaca]MBF8185000.1 GMC family oxidoreductase N-terminal domain-containing protein [Nonomuraea cypriaca]